MNSTTNTTTNTTESSTTVEVSTHVWERLGLGKAPFRFVGMEHKVGPIKTVLPNGLTLEVGAPGQPMSSCDACGQGIALECWILSSDGKRFKVGCDCVAKTEDKAIMRKVDLKKKAHEKTIRAARAAKTSASVAESLADESIRAKLAAQPHPRAFRNRETGEALTLLDWAEWMLANAGAKGRAAVAKAIKAV